MTLKKDMQSEQNIYKALKASILIAAKDDIRPSFRGVHVYTKNKRLYIESTNGHIAIVTKIASPTIKNINVIIDTKEVDRCLKYYLRADKPSFSKLKKSIYYGKIKVDLIDSVFPNIEKAVDKQFSASNKGSHVVLLQRNLNIITKALNIFSDSVQLEVFNKKNIVSGVLFKAEGEGFESKIYLMGLYENR